MFLFISLAALVLIFIGVRINFGSIKPFKKTELLLSPQWELLFDADTLGGLLRNFEEQNPHIRIKRVAAQEASALGDANADILFFDEGQFRRMVLQKALCPLNEYLNVESEVSQWAVPLVFSMNVLFYNIDLLKAAGFDRPPKSREDFWSYAKDVPAVGNGVLGAALGLNDEDLFAVRRDFYSWLLAAGVPIEKDGKLRLETRPTVETLNFLAKLVGRLLPEEEPFAKSGQRRLLEFAQGNLAMLIAPVHEIPAMRALLGDVEFGITAIPGLSTPTKNIVGLSGFYAGISNNCSHPNEAWKFISFVVEKSPQLGIKIKAFPGSLSGNFPLAGAFPVQFANNDPLYEKAKDIFESSFVEQCSFSFPPAIDCEQVIREEQVVREELRQFFAWKLTAQAAATEIQKRMEQVHAVNVPKKDQ